MLGDLEVVPTRVEPTPVRRRRRRILLIVLLSAVLVLGLIAGVVVWKASSLLSGIARDSDMLPVPTTPVVPQRPDQPVNFLVAGADAANGGAPRSDVLIFGHIPADRRAVYLVSLPRDLYVAIPGHGKNKINAAFAFGGMPLAVRTVEKLLDTHIDHAAWLDFEGLLALSEQLVAIFAGVRLAWTKHGCPSGCGPWIASRSMRTGRGRFPNGSSVRDSSQITQAAVSARSTAASLLSLSISAAAFTTKSVARRAGLPAPASASSARLSAPE